MIQSDDNATSWTNCIEPLVANPKALAEYLASRYFKWLTKRALKYTKTNELDTHDLVVEVFFRLIKDNKRTITRLDRNRGSLRALLTNILHRVVVDYYRRKRISTEQLQQIEDSMQPSIEISVDLQGAFSRIQEQRPLLASVFFDVYLEGLSREEVAKKRGINKNALNQRLHSARCFLAEQLKDYEYE